VPTTPATAPAHAAPLPLRDLLLAAVVVVAWGVNFVVIKVGLTGVPPLLLGALRFTLAAFPAVLFVPRPRVAPRWVVAYGATICVGQFAFLFSAMHLGMPAGLASLVLQAQAFFTIGLATVALGERWHLHGALGLALAAGGLWIIGAARGAGEVPVIGLALTLCAALSWAAGNVITKRMGPVDLLSLVVWSALVAPVPFLALSLAIEGPERIAASLAGLGWRPVAAVAYLAFVATLLGYTLWGRLLARHSTHRIAPLTLLVPVVGLLSASLLLGEVLGPAQWAGGALVMAGLLVNVLGGRARAWWAARA
jgi:O-acetylserine/cysteine efflux transporter